MLERDRLWQNVRKREAATSCRSECFVQTTASQHCSILRKDDCERAAEAIHCHGVLREWRYGITN